MPEEEKKIKDADLNSALAIKDGRYSISFDKSKKLIIGLYMVTDIMDTSEPLKNKLRTLGTEVISDIYSFSTQASSKINQIMSFLDIASTMNLISEMNSGILKKEFIKLEHSLKEYKQVKSTWFEDFLANPDQEYIESKVNLATTPFRETRYQSKGHQQLLKTQPLRTRIGVQKGSTLMKALSDKTLSNSFTKFSSSHNISVDINNFDQLRKQRREDIIRIIKTSTEGLTITDIKTKAKELPVPADSIMSCGEKTLQRELISMVKDNVLYKTGEKRWSKYFVKN